MKRDIGEKMTEERTAGTVFAGANSAGGVHRN
jgi:hypothetical protein